MTLAELIQQIDQLADELAIYAAPRWAPSSDVVVLKEPEDGSMPAEAKGKTFLLRVGRAKRVVATRRAWRPDLALSDEHLAAAIIYHAIYDEDEPLPSVMSGEIRLPVAI